MLAGNRFLILSDGKSHPGLSSHQRWMELPCLKSLSPSLRMLWSPGLVLGCDAICVIPNHPSWQSAVGTQHCNPLPCLWGGLWGFTHCLIKAGFHFYSVLLQEGYCFCLCLFLSPLLLILTSTLPMSPDQQDILTWQCMGPISSESCCGSYDAFRGFRKVQCLCHLPRSLSLSPGQTAPCHLL